jgi:hypothetical protein
VSNAFYGSISRDDFESSAIGCLKIISIAIDCNLASLIKYFRKCILWCTWYNAINMITTYGSKKKIILYDFGAPIDGDEYVCDRLTIKSPKPYTFFMFNETP